jgi:hypothetical protein
MEEENPNEPTPDETDELADFAEEWNAGASAVFVAAHSDFPTRSEADKILALTLWPPFGRWRQWIEDGISTGRDHMRAMLLLDFVMNWWFGPGGPGHGGPL